jgi:hypothetical protein
MTTTALTSSPIQSPSDGAGIDAERSTTIGSEPVGSEPVVSLAQTASTRESGYDVEDLVVRIAGRDDGAAIAELATRAGSARPVGALMVAEAGDRLLAAVSLTSGQALSEPTASGSEAQAVVRYTLGRLARRRRTVPPIAA